MLDYGIWLPLLFNTDKTSLTRFDSLYGLMMWTNTINGWHIPDLDSKALE